MSLDWKQITAATKRIPVAPKSAGSVEGNAADVLRQAELPVQKTK